MAPVEDLTHLNQLDSLLEDDILEQDIEPEEVVESRFEDEDIPYREQDKAAETLALEEEWQPTSVNTTAKEAEKPKEVTQTEKPEEPKALTEKQKRKLRMKAKHKNRPKSKSAGQPKPTGFEESFTEAPITPDEYENEREIYSDDRPAIFRLQEALNKYQQKRRLLHERMQVFSQYLRYGGVDVGAKMFGGVSEAELKAMEKDALIAARSQADISVDKMLLDIDFEAVTKGFLSFYFPDFYKPNGVDDIKLATDTIRNWLNYLLYHEVVPEHTESIKSARNCCNLAENQLWNNLRLLTRAPGDFNKASSFLFGGYYHDKDRQSEQPQVWLGENSPHNRTPMTQAVAQKVVMFAIAACGTDEQSSSFHDLAVRGELRARAIEDIDGFEIVDMLPPNNSTRQFYDTHAPDLNIVGKVRAKAWRDPNAPSIDLAPGETLADIKGLEFDFFLEENLLQYCYPGMKVATRVWELNCEVFFFDEIMNAYCTFYTPLLNDLMMGWKAPRDLTRKSNRETDGQDLEEGVGPDEDFSDSE